MMTEKQELFDAIKTCLNAGFSLSYGKADLCDLRNFRHSAIYDRRKFQITCSHPKNECYKIFEKDSDAINCLLFLKPRIGRTR